MKKEHLQLWKHEQLIFLPPKILLHSQYKERQYFWSVTRNKTETMQLKFAAGRSSSGLIRQLTNLGTMQPQQTPNVLHNRFQSLQAFSSKTCNSWLAIDASEQSLEAARVPLKSEEKVRWTTSWHDNSWTTLKPQIDDFWRCNSIRGRGCF